MNKTLNIFLHPEYRKGILKRFEYFDSVIIGVFEKIEINNKTRFIELEIMQTHKGDKELFNDIVIVSMKIYSSLNHPLNPNNLKEKEIDSLLGSSFGKYKKEKF